MGLYLQEYATLDQQHEGGVLVVDEHNAATDAGVGLHLGLGLGLFPGDLPVGLTAGFRSHAVLGGGDWFTTAEVGISYRWGNRTRQH